MSQRRTRWSWVVMACLAAMPCGSGCTAVQGVREYIAYNDMTNDFVLNWRNSAWASQAWHMRKWQFVDQPYFREFGEGFRAGYIDVANGGNGCTPALPPRKYWNWRYQTAEGQAKVAAWFAGYPHGARAAEEDGAGLFSQIQVSELLRKEYQLGHQPPYKSPLFFHNPENWCPPDQMPGEPQPHEDPGPAGQSQPAKPPAVDAPASQPTSLLMPKPEPATQPPVVTPPSALWAAPSAANTQPAEDPYTVLPWVRVASSASATVAPPKSTP
ncbi:MAG: hypothetical protein KatS3mg109_1746 [Pirellulaceae bacterium]|nr:MAG: hypothetical protein KatS3mg109_1746 [Pirellulaceae bacterium]